MSALHFLGRTDTKEEALILSQQQEHDPPTRGASGKFLVLPFFDR